MKPPASMRELIDRARDRHGVGVTGLSRIAAAGKRPISHAALSRYYGGKFEPDRLTRATLESLAYLAGVSYEVARDAAGADPGFGPFTDEVPAKFDQLRPDERRVVLDVGWSILKSNHGNSGTITETGPQFDDEIVSADIHVTGMNPEDVLVIEDTDQDEAESS